MGMKSKGDELSGTVRLTRCKDFDAAIGVGLTSIQDSQPLVYVRFDWYTAYDTRRQSRSSAAEVRAVVDTRARWYRSANASPVGWPTDF